MKELPPLTRLKEVLTYDPNSGEFRWTNKLPKRMEGTLATVQYSEGYLIICFDGKAYFAHRLAYLYFYGKSPDEGFYVDHKNRIKNDNRIENLRLATRSQNLHNRTLHKKSTTGFRGVHYNKARKLYSSIITKDRKTYVLGFYETAEEASEVYLKKAKELFGEFSYNDTA